MDDVMKKQNAQRMFGVLCQMLDNQNWKYSANKEELSIECSARGEDLPIELVIRVNKDMQLLQMFSPLPFTVPEDKRLDTAVAVSVANNKMVHGCFDYNITNGNLFFRINSSFMGGLLSQESCKYMVFCGCATIDNYNDKFLMLAKGMLSLEQFLKAEM